jgi:hypothetical protein
VYSRFGLLRGREFVGDFRGEGKLNDFWNASAAKDHVPPTFDVSVTRKSAPCDAVERRDASARILLDFQYSPAISFHPSAQNSTVVYVRNLE